MRDLRHVVKNHGPLYHKEVMLGPWELLPRTAKHVGKGSSCQKVCLVRSSRICSEEASHRECFCLNIVAKDSYATLQQQYPPE